MASLNASQYIAIASAGLAVTVAASWAGCGGSDEAGTGGAKSGGTGGGSSGGQTNGGTGGTGGVPDGGTPCKWAGWYHPPRMPPGCDRLCIPDDPAARLPHLTWSTRDDFCVGCKGLDTPWAPAETGPLNHPVAAGVFGVGPSPSIHSIAILEPGTETAAYFNSAGTAVAAWRATVGSECGFSSGVAFSHAGLVAQNFRMKLGDDQYFVMRPLEKIAELMSATDTTLLWPAAFVGKNASSSLSFSTDLVAADFLGRTAIGEFGVGKAFWIDELSGAQPGQYTNPQVVGHAALVGRFDFEKTDWWLVESGKLTLFLGGLGKDIDDLVTDGTVIVWTEGTNPIKNDAGVTVFTQYNLYKAPFVTDAAKLKPTLLVPNVTRGLSYLRLDNGYLSATFYRKDMPTDPTDAFVVRVADGWAAKSELPVPYFWGSATFPAASELWGGAAVDATGTAVTIIRVPYTSMKVIQTTAPPQDGGG